LLTFATPLTVICTFLSTHKVLFPVLYETGRGQTEIAAAEAKSKEKGSRNFMMVEVKMWVGIAQRAEESFIP
jgi:hypothetical protein